MVTNNRLRTGIKPNTNCVSEETASEPSGTSVAIYSYTYRADGLKTGETDQTLNSDGTTYDTRTLTWQYDGLDRLTQETSTDTAGVAALNYTDNYQYDLDSNRVSETTDNTNGTDTITSTYNADDELTQAVDANTGTTLYGYDANGSQTSVTHTPNGTTTPDTTTTNEYDLQGQLAGSQVTTSAGTATTTYFYDDSGNRIEEVTIAAGSTTPVVTYYLVDTNNPTGYSQPIEQASTPGTPQITYIWGAQLISQTYATGATIPGVGTASSPTTYYLLQDAHGSTRVVTDATGKAVQEMNYDAFGNALGFNAATALTTYLYSSMPFDAASGNYYDHARFYDSGSGEFTQADYGYAGQLNNPMSFLPYVYGGGDPINMSDLSGHDFEVVDVGVSVDLGEEIDAVEQPALAPALGSADNVVTTSRVLSTLLWGGVIGGAGIAAMEFELAAGRSLEPLVSSLNNVEMLAIDNGVATKNKLDRLPIFWVFKYGPTATPEIWENDATAIRDHAYWAVLTYIGPNNRLRRINRGDALAGKGVAGDGKSWDEYPFATTFEGGAGAQVRAVDSGEQGAQAGYLSSFYQYDQMSVPSAPFLVVPVPFPPA